MKHLRPALAIAMLLVAACSNNGSSPSVSGEPTHTVREYYDDDALRAAALKNCMSDNEAEVDANLKKPSCSNATQAEKDHQLGMKPE